MHDPRTLRSKADEGALTGQSPKASFPVPARLAGPLLWFRIATPLRYPAQPGAHLGCGHLGVVCHARSLPKRVREEELSTHNTE